MCSHIYPQHTITTHKQLLNTPNKMSDAEAQQQACPRCQQTDFNYEDLDEGTKLVCRDCGYVLDEILLVNQRAFDEDGAAQAGVRVSEADDGRWAGAAMLPAAGAGGNVRAMRASGSGSSRQLVLSTNKERLDGALSYLELPQHIATAARQLLPQVVQAYGEAEPRMLMSPATVAAVVYITTRQEGRALSLGTAAAALDVPGPEVFKECKRVLQVCGLQVPPPSLEATVVHTAARLLPHYVSDDLNGPLRRQPLVVKALQLAQLIMDVGASEGRSPWVGAAAVWSIVLAEHFKDANSKAYARQVAGHLQHDAGTVQQHITVYDKELAPLLEVLPFYGGTGSAEAGVQVVKHAGVLLKLQKLSRSTAGTASG